MLIDMKISTMDCFYYMFICIAVQELNLWFISPKIFASFLFIYNLIFSYDKIIKEKHHYLLFHIIIYMFMFIYFILLKNTYVDLILFSLASDYYNLETRSEGKIKYTSTSDSNLITATPGSVGLDIKSNLDITINPYEIGFIPTGLHIETPLGYYAQLATRSSMAMKNLIVIGGVIDPDYRGEIIVMLKNLNNHTYKIHKNDKIAQLICIKYTSNVKNVTKLSSTVRGFKGFGHTGV